MKTKGTRRIAHSLEFILNYIAPIWINFSFIYFFVKSFAFTIFF